MSVKVIISIIINSLTIPGTCSPLLYVNIIIVIYVVTIIINLWVHTKLAFYTAIHVSLHYAKLLYIYKKKKTCVPESLNVPP